MLKVVLFYEYNSSPRNMRKHSILPEECDKPLKVALQIQLTKR